METLGLVIPFFNSCFFLLVIPICFVVYSFWLRAPTGQGYPGISTG